MKEPAAASVEFLTTEDLAALLHVTAETVRDMAARGEMPRTKVGKRWLFPRADLLAWLADRTSGPTTAPVPVQPAAPMPAPATAFRPSAAQRVVIFPNASWRTESELKEERTR